MRELPAGRRAPETRAQELALVDELLGEPVEEAIEQLLVETRLLGARLPADSHEVVEGVAFVFEAAPVDVLVPRHHADRALHRVPRPCTRSTIHLSTRIFWPKPGQRNLPSSSRRNQLTRKIRGGLATCRPTSSQWVK